MFHKNKTKKAFTRAVSQDLQIGFQRVYENHVKKQQMPEITSEKEASNQERLSHRHIHQMYSVMMNPNKKKMNERLIALCICKAFMEDISPHC